MKYMKMAQHNSIIAELKELKEYTVKNRWVFLITVLLFVLMYVAWIANPTPRIDGEILINSPSHSEIYYARGQGNLLTEYVFSTNWFNPLFSNLASFLFLSFGMILLGYLAYKAGINLRASAFLGAFVLTSPIMIELYYFDMLLFKASWAYILVFVAAGLTVYNKKGYKWVCWLIAMLLLYWAIATYETFAGVYITTIVFVYIARYYRSAIKQQSSVQGKEYYLYIVRSIIILIGAIILNKIIGYLFNSSENTYLASKMLWNQRPITDSLASIASIIKKGFLGVGVFYTPFLLILAISVLFLSIVHFIMSKKTFLAYLYVLVCVVLQVCPFLMAIALGGYPDAIRTQLTYPMVVAIDIALLLSFIDKKIIKILVAILAICVLWTQTQTTMRLEYTDQIRGKEDIFVAQEMIHKIDRVCDNVNTPILIVGTYKDVLNGSCLRGEMIGTSIFGYADYMSPAYVSSSLRTFLILKTLGIERNSLVDKDLAIEARKLALNMPSYPNEGCVLKTDNFIIYKLSEDEWTNELN